MMISIQLPRWNANENEIHVMRLDKHETGSERAKDRIGIAAAKVMGASDDRFYNSIDVSVVRG